MATDEPDTTQQPIASTSKLVKDEAEPSDGNRDEAPRPELERSPSSAKGKAKLEEGTAESTLSGESMQLDEQEPEKEMDDTEENEKGDPEEVILMTVVPKAKIVGLKYSGGIRTLKEGMELEVRRDKFNVADKNAIEVRHVRGLRIGFISKILAARLAPLINERKITLAAVSGPVPHVVTGIDDVPMALEIHGKRKYMRDERLDWAFPKRVEKLRARKEKEKLLKQAKEKLAKDQEEEYEEGEKRKGKGGENGGGGTSSGGGGGKGFSGDLAMTHAVLLERKTRPTQDMLSSMFSAGSMDPSKLPIHPCPPGRKDGTMKTNLMEFQRQGLAWMIEMEHPVLPKKVEDPPVQLWSMKKDEDGKTFWFNVGTETTQREKPILKRGGILADEMGLGKTMQTIALICTDDTGEGVLPKPEDPDERFDDMTLIVCPLSVASNWTDQFQQHVGKKRLKWHFYHGEGRELTKKQLREFDCVITTYQTLVGGIEEVTPKPKTKTEEEEEAIDADEADVVPPPAKKQKRTVKDGTLHAIKWRRIVLDEGHLIKNPKAKMSRAAAELTAERRWILTGTPIVNAAADLGAMIQFLRICKPLDDPEVWKRYVPIKKEKGKPPAPPDPETAQLLRAVVLSSTLRRTKNMVNANGEPLVKLPELASYQIKVKLTGAARETYDEVFKQLGKIIEGLVKKDTAGAKYSQLLSYLLRLRQIACDPTLCPPDFIEMIRDEAQADHLDDEFKRASGDRGDNSEQQMTFLRRLLRQLDEEECSVCSSIVVEARITICQHIFCQSCIEYAVETNGGCPVCYYPLTAKGIVGPERSVTPAATSTRSSSVSGVGGTVERSAKTAELIRLLKATAPGVKTLVFSQWTSHLDRIEAALHEEKITTCRFDGSMRQEKREQVIKSFTAPNKEATAGSKADKKSPMVMLLSLKAGALGLNLTVASQVVLMDPWWQPAIEQQAIDRVNRIGQTQKVRVFQIVAEDTVEDKVLEIQASKEKLIAEAFSGNRGTEQGRQKIAVPFQFFSSTAKILPPTKLNIHPSTVPIYPPGLLNTSSTQVLHQTSTTNPGPREALKVSRSPNLNRMNGQYNYPSYDGSIPSWSMHQYYNNSVPQYEYDHRRQHHHLSAPAQQVPVAQVPVPYSAAYGYPSYAPSSYVAMEQQPTRSRFAFAAQAQAQSHPQQFSLPPPAYSYASAYPGVEEQMRSQSHERAAGWGVGGDYGRQESAQRATLNGEQRSLQFLLSRLNQSSANSSSFRHLYSSTDDYHTQVQAQQDDDKTVVYDLIPNTSSVPPPPPVELSAVPLADLAVEMVWEACRQGFLLARDNQIAASHAASLNSSTSSSRRRSGRDSFGTIGDGRVRSSSADGFASDSSSTSSSLPGTPGVVSAQEEEARRQRLANLGLSDFMPIVPSRKNSSIPTFSSSVFPVEPSIAFRQFVKQILNATLVTPEDLVFALYYVSQIAPAEIIPPTPAEGGQDAQTTSFKAAPFKIFLGSLMLANKSLQDNSYRNETFSTVSGIPLKDVNALEIYVFSALKYDVALREDKWVQWLNTVAFKVLAGVRGEIGSRLAIEEALGRLVYAARNNKNTVGAPSTTPAPSSVSVSVDSSMVDLDAAGPLEDKVAAVAPPSRRRTPVSRAGLCRTSSDVPSLLPPVSLANTRARSFGQEVGFRQVC
ncbi:uncharacterized protein JCM6883_003541 [Sporobolomyces salmoneus]|uniref:uncharacterized protein n=1 Tax=Sporobolomyces salmoneus TaxID=183962 RepID=UPI00317B8FA6